MRLLLGMLSGLAGLYVKKHRFGGAFFVAGGFLGGSFYY
jgi:hypothetical protein